MTVPSSENSLSKGNEITTQDRAAVSYEEIRYKLPWSRRYHAWLFKYMIGLLQPEGKILDAGCGTGWLGEFLPKEQLWGIDLSPEMVARAKTRLRDARIGDVEALPFEDRSFDRIFARSVIHHLANPERGVAELARVLKVGGRMVLLDTRDQNVFSRIFRKKMREGEHFSELHQNLREDEYLELINRYLQVEKTEYLGYLAYTLLGFPDVFNLYGYIPGKFLWTPFLMAIDKVCARLPLFNRLGLGMIVVARKRAV
jgi:ubiquinone/menaquinone biosynthesis C-methylase UbiE